VACWHSKRDPNQMRWRVPQHETASWRLVRGFHDLAPHFSGQPLEYESKVIDGIKSDPGSS
jgi:hypothetical protein